MELSVPTATILGNGIYSFSEVARLTGLRVQRVRSWFLGVSHQARPLMEGDYQTVSSSHALSFLDLIDTLVVGQLRELGVPMYYLRRLRHELIDEFGTCHPFSKKNLLTDGRRAFIHLLDELGEEQLREALSHQHAFPEVLLPYLKQMEYDPRSLFAKCWHIADGIVVDPKRQYGKPIVIRGGIPTAILATAYEANSQDLEVVADWYGVSPVEVDRAVGFENRLNGHAA